MQTGTNQSGHSMLQDIIYCCTIFLSGYRFPSEVGQVRLWGHIMSFHRTHTQTCVEVTLNVTRRRHYAFCVCDSFSNATGCVFFALRCYDKKTHNSCQHMEPATPIHTVCYFQLSHHFTDCRLCIIFALEASSLLIMRAQRTHNMRKFYASFPYDSNKIQPYRKYKKITIQCSNICSTKLVQFYLNKNCVNAYAVSV